jgi:hypothetical protein
MVGVIARLSDSQPPNCCSVDESSATSRYPAEFVFATITMIAPESPSVGDAA